MTRPDRPVLRDYDPEKVAQLWAEASAGPDDSEPTVTVQPTTYTVSLLPLDDIDAFTYQITVEYRGRGLWAVCRPKRCFGADGEWDWESIPSEREDEWLASHRFDKETALAMAREAAPNVKVNGVTAREVAARIGGTS